MSADLQNWIWHFFTPRSSLYHSKTFFERVHQARTSCSNVGQSATTSRMSPEGILSIIVVIFNVGWGHFNPFVSSICSAIENLQGVKYISCSVVPGRGIFQTAPIFFGSGPSFLTVSTIPLMIVTKRSPSPADT